MPGDMKMPTKRLLPLAAALMGATLATSANANVIDFEDPAQTAFVGDHVSFDISIDFIQSTVGGALDVLYDSSLLSFVSWEFNDSFLASVADPDFSVFPDNCFSDGAAIGGCSVGDAELNGIGFGSFDGIVGTHIIGTLTFEALDIGAAVLTMSTNDAPWEGFFSAVDASELVVVYGSGKVHIQAIPLPAGFWLFASALGLLAGRLRRRT